MVAAAASQPPSAEEEALKRNTDCVYFLASPLTCKKGSECEYRHSDIARVNPRDCWFWLHGNCLNPKCGFRHPPLDGLLGMQMASSTGPTQLPLQPATTPSTQVVNAAGEQRVPCKFFQNGFCLKGDWCPFLHAQNSMTTKLPLVPGTASSVETTTSGKAFGGREKGAQEKKVPLMNVAKRARDFPDSQPAVEMEPAINRGISGMSCINEFPYYSSVPPVSNGNAVNSYLGVHQSHLLDESGIINNKDEGEASREPSPGFDVLVNGEGRDLDFYHSRDQYGMSREYEDGNGYDIGHSTDYDMIAEIDNERYQGPLAYDSDGFPNDQYAMEQHRVSSARVSGGSSYFERRPYLRADSYGQVDELDLRHHLAKNKLAPNGLRSVISFEHAGEKHVGDRKLQGLHRHQRPTSLHENSLSCRLRGRIKLPQGPSSPIDRNMSKGSDRGRLSPVRACWSFKQGKIQNRIKGRVQEASSNGWKNHRGLHLRRDTISDNNVDFARPKSLAELKNRKNAEPSGLHVTDEQPLGKRKYLIVNGHQQSGNDISFEGPKALEEILKRKRGETSRDSSANNEDIFEDNQKEGKDGTNNESISCVGIVNKNDVEESRRAALQAEEGNRIVAYKPRGEESDSEQLGGENFDLYGDAEGEYVDDNDNNNDDDFAKQMGVTYS